jgi:oxygen-independent coproporphyrinogen-3 oxidase
MNNRAGLYIHIPFCQAKCGYCSFNSIPANRQLADAYLQTLRTQIDEYSSHPRIQTLRFNSIFFGGGTPTLASPEKLGELLGYLRNHFSCDTDLEISIEANPNSVTPVGLAILHRAGFNRLSLGIQSFHNRILTRLNRTHTGDQARQAVHWAREAGFTNLSCDLIYGLPEQTTEIWQQDLHTILELRPEHLSLYELSVEPGTPFHREQKAQTLILPEDDMLADMEECSKTMLSPAYSQYEISNFSIHAKQCRHNLTYWQNGDYLGLGAGAVSCIDGMRFTHAPSPALFMDNINQTRSTIVHAESLSPKARFRETIVMGLRLLQGVHLGQLEQQAKLSHQQVYGTLVEDLVAKGHLQYAPPYLSIPPELLGVANQILHQLV